MNDFFVTLGTLFDVDIEHPFEQPGVAHPGQRRARGRIP
jgi:hypothetical protein